MSEAAPVVYPAGRTALIVIDAINDFIAEEGKLWSYVSDVVTGVGMKENLQRLIAAARAAGVTVVPAPMETHPWDYNGWQNRALDHQLLGDMQIFQAGTWGAEFHPDFAPQPGDVVVAAHKGLDAFFGTDLDVQLRQRGIDHILISGMATNTCVESTGRDAFEKGYHLTFVSDACGAFTWEAHKASIELNWPASLTRSAPPTRPSPPSRSRRSLRTCPWLREPQHGSGSYCGAGYRAVRQDRHRTTVGAKRRSAEDPGA